MTPTVRLLSLLAFLAMAVSGCSVDATLGVGTRTREIVPQTGIDLAGAWYVDATLEYTNDYGTETFEIPGAIVVVEQLGPAVGFIGVPGYALTDRLIFSTFSENPTYFGWYVYYDRRVDGWVTPQQGAVTFDYNVYFWDAPDEPIHTEYAYTFGPWTPASPRDVQGTEINLQQSVVGSEGTTLNARHICSLMRGEPAFSLVK